MKKIYLIETISEHKFLYAVTSDKDLHDLNNQADLSNFLSKSGIAEVKQDWVGEHLHTVSEVMDIKEYIKKIDTIFPDINLTNEEKILAIVDIDIPLTLMEDKDII